MWHRDKGPRCILWGKWRRKLKSLLIRPSALKSSLTVSINFVFVRLHGTKAQVVILDTGARIVARLRIIFAHDVRN